MGLLDFKVDVVLARLEADFSEQPPSIPAVPNHQVSWQCPTAEYPSAQPPSIPAVLNGCAKPQNIPAVPNHQVSLQCPTPQLPLHNPYHPPLTTSSAQAFCSLMVRAPPLLRGALEAAAERYGAHFQEVQGDLQVLELRA